MINLSRDRLLDIAKYFIHKAPPAGDKFQNVVGEFYKKAGDTPEGVEVKKQFEKAFSDKSWKTDLSEEDMITLAKKINYGPLYHAIAARLSPNKRNDAFPELKDKFESAPAMGTTTTTANTAPYPVPLGSMMRREDPTKKKKKKKEKPKKKANKKGKI